MFKSPSLTVRIAIGKAIGFVIGLIGFFSLPLFWPEVTMMFRVGILFWYTTLGLIVGLLGVYTWHPIIHLPLPWWFRAPFIGGWMNFVLALFTWDTMKTLLVSFFGQQGVMTSPLWFVLEGALVGLLIGYLATRFGGEGKQTVEESG